MELDQKSKWLKTDPERINSAEHWLARETGGHTNPPRAEPMSMRGGDDRRRSAPMSMMYTGDPKRVTPNVSPSTDGPMGGNQSLPMSPVGMVRQSDLAVSSISTHPPFVAERYGNWEKIMNWRAELPKCIGESRLLAAVGLIASGVEKGATHDYLEETRDGRHSMAVSGFITLMDMRFRRPTEERAIRMISQRNIFRGKQASLFRSIGLNMADSSTY